MKQCVLFLCLPFFLLFSCGRPEAGGIDWGKLERKYAAEKDSLKLKAVAFLKENTPYLGSETVEFYRNDNNQIVPLSFADYKNDTILKEHLFSNNIDFRPHYRYDTTIITTADIAGTIEEAFADWRKYPWNKHVSFDHFLNYLLPYKVFDEYPGAWRKDVKKRYAEDISELIQKSRQDSFRNLYMKSNELYYAFNLYKVGRIFDYTPRPSFMSKSPGYDEILCFRYGDCYAGSYLNVYFLRAIGIPATVDFIPHWGCKNGTHSAEVFIDETGKFSTPSGRELVNCAKAFRLHFRKQDVWKDSIAPFVDSSKFVLKHLQHNHWSDVTGEHTRVKDIALPAVLKGTYGYSYAYICVLDYGRWAPLYWGKVTAKDTVTFRNMGYPMLYRVAIQDGDSYKIASPVYMVDSAGKVNHIAPDFQAKIDASFQKLNTGTDSWVEKGEEYDLFVMNGNSTWQAVASGICAKDSVISFSRIPGNGLYRLVKKGDMRELSRPFTISNKTQVWW